MTVNHIKLLAQEATIIISVFPVFYCFQTLHLSCETLIHDIANKKSLLRIFLFAHFC